MWLVVSNPFSGGGKGAKERNKVLGLLRAKGIKLQEITGSSAHDMEQQLADIRLQDFQGCIAIGGDGLVNLVIQFLANSTLPLLVIPAGTGNDIARSLNLDLKNPANNVELALMESPRSLDLGKVNGRYFLQILSTGFDSLVNERANKIRWLKGRLKYNLAILEVLSTFKPKQYFFKVDGVEFSAKAMLIAVANGKSYGGGMMISPSSKFDDGLLDLMILGPVSKIEFIRVFPSVYQGQHVNHPAVKFLSGRNIYIDSDAIAYADGERVGTLPIHAEVLSGAIKMWSK